MKKSRKNVIKISISILLIAIIAFRLDWTETIQVFASIKIAWVPVLFVLYTFDRFVMAVKWQYLLSAFNLKISFLEAITYYYLGGMMGILTQWQSGGDLARIAEAGRRTGRFGSISTSVILEKVAGLNALALISVVSGVLLNLHLKILPNQIGFVVGIILAIIFGVMPFITIRYIPSGWIATILEKLPFNTLHKIGGMIHNFDKWENLSAVYPKFFLLTFLEQFIPIIGLFLLSLAMQITLPISTIFAFLPIAMLIARIPISVEAIGVKEGLYVFFMSIYGYGASVAFALAVSTRVLDLLVVGSGAMVTNILFRGNKEELSHQ